MTRFKHQQFAITMASALAGLAILLIAIRNYSGAKKVPQIERNEVKTEIHTVDKDAYATANYIGAITPADTIDTLPWPN